MFLLNELSIHNQYQSEADFESSLNIVLACRDLLRKYKRTLHCGQGTLGNRPVIRSMSFRQVVGNIPNKNVQRLVMLWVDRDGPFWDENKFHDPEEIFSDNNDEIISNSELAEAAYRLYQKMDSSVVSFSPSDYLHSPIVVKWHRDSDSILEILVANYSEILLLSDLLSALQPPIQSWGQLIEYANIHYKNSTFAAP